MSKHTIGEDLMGALADFNSEVEKKEFIDKSGPKKEKPAKPKKNDNKKDFDKTLSVKDEPDENVSEKEVSMEKEQTNPLNEDGDNSSKEADKKQKNDTPKKEQKSRSDDVTIRTEDFPSRSENKSNEHGSKVKKNLVLKTKLQNANKTYALALINIDSGEIFTIKHSALLGQANHCDISLFGEKYVSKEHAKIMKDGDGLMIEDLNSTNGTKLNGMKIRSSVAKENDIVSFANVKFKVQKVEV